MMRLDLKSKRATSDRGFTLVEMLIVMSLMGVMVSALSMAISITLKASPEARDRIDDARATRSLSTWLANDTTSSPPYLPERPQGGINIDTSATATNNDCGAGGQNILHLQWTENTTSSVEYVANYRFEVAAGEGRIMRYTCHRDGAGAFVADNARKLTPGLDPSSAPVASASFDASGNVSVIAFTLTGQTSETVLIESSSRNPSDFFP